MFELYRGGARAPGVPPASAAYGLQAGSSQTTKQHMVYKIDILSLY